MYYLMCMRVSLQGFTNLYLTQWFKFKSMISLELLLAIMQFGSEKDESQ
jgi:hypothetical protein